MEREREDTEEGMTDVLSSYTRLLSRPKLMNDAKLIDISERNDNGELGQYGFEKPAKEVVDIELTEEEFCPANLELKREDDDTENVNCSDVEEQATPTNVSVSSNDEDFDDFKLDGPWCCGLCTFNNNGLLRVCEICETPRHKSRRKLTKTALSTPEFVKRKQQKILERCLSSEKKTKSRNQGLKKDNFPFVMQGDTEERLGFVGTTRDDGISEYQAETIEDETSRELQEFENSSFDTTASSFKTRVEPQGQSTSLVEDELLSKTRDLSEADHSKALKSDRTPSVVAEGDEEVSGELMKSSDESAEEATAVAEELFLPGNEFDDLAVEDWWQCEACHKYNYNEMADMCEMCGQTKTEPSVQLRDSVLDLGKNWWRCEECGEYHFDDRGTSCGKCGFGRDGRRAEKIVATDWKKYRHLMVNDCDGSEGHGRTTQTVENLMFCLSCHTDRVYLYNEGGQPLKCNVSLLDLETSNTENFPEVLLEASNRKQALQFLRRWKSLPERQRRLVRRAGVVFEDPYEAVEAVKMGREHKLTTSRFPSKKLQAEVVAAALENNGTVRHCLKTKAGRRGGVKNPVTPKTSSISCPMTSTTDTNQRTWIQAVDEDGRPLCIYCKSPVDTKNTENQWDERFCSYKCKENYQCRTSGTRVRQVLFEEERGVCQRCRFDAYGLYRTLKLLPKAERRPCLENTSFMTLPVTFLNKIIIDPKEGMFWEADHVVPVVEGGGECGFDNYRTLCVPCHRKVTSDLLTRLKTNRQKTMISGIADITSFFNS